MVLLYFSTLLSIQSTSVAARFLHLSCLPLRHDVLYSLFVKKNIRFYVAVPNLLFKRKKKIVEYTLDIPVAPLWGGVKYGENIGPGWLH